MSKFDWPVFVQDSDLRTNLDALKLYLDSLQTGASAAQRPSAHVWANKTKADADPLGAWTNAETVTFTCPLAGLWKLSRQGQFLVNTGALADYSYQAMSWTTTTTGTRVTSSQEIGWEGDDSNSDPQSRGKHNLSFELFNLSQGDTVGIVPRFKLAGGTTADGDYIWTFSCVMEYIGDVDGGHIA